MPPDLQEQIAALYKREPLDGYVFHTPWGEEPEKFYKKVGPNWIYYRFKKLFEKAGIDVRVKGAHVMRKTFATTMYRNLMDAGVPDALLIVNKILGHSTVELTTRYLGLNRERLNMGFSMLNYGPKEE